MRGARSNSVHTSGEARVWSRMRTRSRSIPELTLGAIGLAAALMATLHCGTTEDASAAAASAGEDGGGGTDLDDGGEAVVTDDDSGATVVKSDGGTIDSGIPNTPFTVCGGSKGDPGAVPVLDWAVFNNPWKYKVLLGASAPDDEPLSYSSTIIVATGTRYQDQGQTSSAIVGGGPFGSQGPLTRFDFVKHAMPTTDIAFSELGWTEFNESVYDLRTKLAQSGWQHYRVAGTAGHLRRGAWYLDSPKKAPGASATHYVRSIVPTHGFGWFFTIVFDHECKANALDALVGNNALAILEPPPGVTRAQVSKFLVENNARLFLTASTYGAEDPNIKAALVGTQASAATLDALEATMTAFTAAMKAYSNNVGTETYESVSNATNPSWVIGALRFQEVANLPPP